MNKPIYYTTITQKPHFYLSENQIVKKNYIYDYTYYFDWLRQRENSIAECAISAHSHLLLTNKALCIHTRYKSAEENLKILPLNKVNSIEVHFQRLIFPLIIGGIVAPLALVAAFLNMAHFWISMAMSLSGWALVYYGWAGAYQLKITAFQAQQMTYFIDFKTRKLEKLIEETQKLLLLRQALFQ